MADESILEKAFAAATEGEVPTQQVDVDFREVVAALRVDAEFFIEFFLAEQLDMPVPEFHKEIWGLLTDLEKERILLAIPRDHAKTTLAKLVVIWYWLFTEHRFCAYLSNTAPIAKGACRDIIAFVQENANFIEVFGRVKIVKQSENEGLWIFELTMPNGRVKTCMLRALGQGQQMRGINIDNQRPDIAVVDDVEDNDNTESETQQKKLDRWMFGPFLKALARRKKILWLGNMLTKTSLLARLSRNPRWNPVVFGSLVKDTVSQQLRPLWPGKWSVEALKEDFKEYKDNGLIETWMCEMMNMPGHGENGFSLEQINYMPMLTPDTIQAAWITIDPAFGQNAENDETSIAVHAIPTQGGVPMTVAVSHGKFDEYRMLSEALSLAIYWNAWVWGIEAVAAQRLLISLFSVLLAGRGMSGRVEMIPLMAGRGDPKYSRIRAFVNLMANKEWAIPDEDIDITNQILSYDFRKKEQEDDIVDSCAYGPMMMEMYLAVILASASGEDFASDSNSQHGMEVASV
jgi:hypothetical protein